MAEFALLEKGAALQKEMGRRIKKLRLLQERTIEDLANASGLSKSMISKIENNKAIPSVAALVNIASALGVAVSDILETDETLAAEYTSGLEALESLAATGKGYNIFPFASKYHKKKMQPFLFVARKGEVVEHAVSHQGEEFIYVLEGVLRFRLEHTEYELKEGDSIYFNSVESHGIMPVTDEVVYLDVFV
ncbi:MAG: XRE family transcriptional regulator [Balneolaceae bacterium]